MKIGKILIGGLLASSSIGNTGSTFVGYGFHGLEKTLATSENLDYYNNFVENQPQDLAELKIIDQRLTGNYEFGKPTSVSYDACHDACRQIYLLAAAQCLAIPEPISQGICHGFALAALGLCMANCP